LICYVYEHMQLFKNYYRKALVAILLSKRATFPVSKLQLREQKQKLPIFGLRILTLAQVQSNFGHVSLSVRLKCENFQNTIRKLT
jgi:hypothetical protein